MNLAGNTVLITGGSSGIGLGLAEAFLERGNVVVICGRRPDRLAEAKEKLPPVHTRVCDVSDEASRRELTDWVADTFEGLNILINNAGIQKDIDFRKGTEDLTRGPDEVRINVDGPVYLSAHLIPLLARHKEAAIINVSSVLAFAPMARVPVYCATKAFLHNFTQSLRFQLKSTGIRVFEIMPPRVKTELNSEGRRKMGYADSGIEVADFVGTVMTSLERGEEEIEYGRMNSVKNASRADLDAMFSSINDRTFSW